MGTSEFLKTGQAFRPVPGKRYENLNGCIYKCVKIWPDGTPRMQSVCTPNGSDHWTFDVYDLRQYIDGCINWGHSINGDWEAEQ